MFCRFKANWVMAAMVVAISVQCCLMNAQDPTPLTEPGSNQDASGKTISTTVNLYNLFGEIDEHQPLGDIWTRAYGFTLGDSTVMPAPNIPGPTAYVQPGDLFQVNFFNELSEVNHPDIREYESLIPITPFGSSKDDVAKGIVHHEINIPHNPNNVNLHVHGLHVAPSRDDVTIVVVPEGTPPSEVAKYSQPLKFLPKEFTERDVSDRPVQAGKWNYYYKIPDFHLPGTHWYHSHKHGSTALQTENGMSGTIVMGQWSKLDPLASVNRNGAVPDRVMILQGLLNYGLNFGKGTGKGKESIETQTLHVTLNGQTNPSLSVAKNQLERWRIVNATANHANMSYIWLGGTNDGGMTYDSVDVHAIAVDGITLPNLVPINAGSPLLLSPGNRADLLVQLDGTYSEYTLLKNVPSGITKIDGNVVTTTTELQWLANGPLVNPYIFTDADKAPGVFTSSETNKLSGNPLVPLLRVTPVLGSDGSNLLDVIIGSESIQGRTPLEPQSGDIGWQNVGPFTVGGGLPGVKILTIAVDSSMTPTNTTTATTIDPRPFSPSQGGTLANVPAYTSSIGNTDILQSRAAVFDVSGVKLNAQGTVNGKAAFQNIQQFTINGRVFAMNDAIGGPNANKLVSRSAGDHLIEFVEDIEPVINFTNSEDSYVNPGYYRQLQSVAGTTFQYEPLPPATATKDFKFPPTPVSVPTTINTNLQLFDTTTGESIPGKFVTYTKYPAEYYPTLSNITGIDVNQVSVQNTKYANPDRVPTSVPGLPVATTAEEWILINNSNIGHPFHIHINPFFVTEIGQLTHNTNEGWTLNKITQDANEAKSPMAWQVGKWWDTILIPPRGYVKMRYWFNVPEQVLPAFPGSPEAADPVVASQIKVLDNQNIEGVWVYHCHILRHEDRGMMMVVETQKNSSPDAAKEDARKARARAKKGLKLPGTD